MLEPAMNLLSRRHVLVALCFLLVLSVLAGCGASNENAAPASDPATEALAPLALGPDVDAPGLAEIKDRPDVFVLDVREQWEYDEGHIPGVTLLPMNSVPDRLSEIPTDKTVVVTCRSGNRSSQVVEFLRRQGFTNVHNMTGGILAWQAAGLPVER